MPPEANTDSSYLSKRAQLATYFDETASKTWERLTSDAPVSRIRETVRQGREQMAGVLLGILPKDMKGMRILDAGCGAGPLSIKMAERGADVIAVDISASLVDVAERRTPAHLKHQITYKVGDMLTAVTGQVDAIIAMDSLIHYDAEDIAKSLERLARNCRGAIAFTIAPKTLPLTAMHLAGKAFPKSDRSPAIIPVSPKHLTRVAEARLNGRHLWTHERIASGFYISQAMEVCP
ncbi:MAG: magnesium protoporphyrin IX methyltransferase [Pseudomonadota bacterium]